MYRRGKLKKTSSTTSTMNRAVARRINAVLDQEFHGVRFLL
jgi:hypothetical protein